MDYNWLWQAGAAGWNWRCLDPQTGSLIAMGKRTFLLLCDCVEDATTHGYRAPPHAGDLSTSARVAARSLPIEARF
jgi:hypothetical protein